MWPLSGCEIVSACGGRCGHPHLDQVRIEAASVGDRPPQPATLLVALREGDRDGHPLVEPSLRAGSSLAVVAEDWPGLDALAPPLRARCVIVHDTLVAYRSLAAFMRSRFEFPVVAIGGSCGKTTTKDLLAALLGGGGRRVSKTPQTMNGFSGLPFTLCQQEHNRARLPDALVVEIGIDRPGAMQEHLALVAPDVVLLTALGPEHLAGLGSERCAIEEEKRLLGRIDGRRRIWQLADAEIAGALETAGLETAQPGDVLVCPRGQLEVPVWTRRGVDVLTFETLASGTAASEVELCWSKAGGDGFEQRFVVPSPGPHNVANFAVACGAACGLGRNAEELQEGLRGYRPAPGRLQAATLSSGGTLLDDSYNASPASVQAALEVLGTSAWRHRPKIVILGDMLDLGEAAPVYVQRLAEPLSALAPQQLLLFGDGLRALKEALLTAGYCGSVHHVSTDGDPRALLEHLDHAELADAVLLVKGSRGMRLERVVEQLQTSRRVADSDSRSARRRCCVMGMRQQRLVGELVAAALGLYGSSAVEVLSLEALRRGRAASAQVVVFTDFDSTACAPESPELALARFAQPIMQLTPGGCAILNSTDPAAALLAEIVPSGVELVRYEQALSVQQVTGAAVESAATAGPDWQNTAVAAALAVGDWFGEPRSSVATAVSGALLDLASKRIV